MTNIMTADDYYELGNKCRQEGKLAEALNNYLAAANLSPSSHAKEMAEMMENIINYYCKDIYNP